MSWTTVIWLCSAGVCIVLAVVYLLVWLQDRKAWENLAFSVWTSAVAISLAFELAMMHSPTRENYAKLLGMTPLPFAVMAIAYFAFVRLYLQAGRRWLMWSVFGILALELLVKVTLLPIFPFAKIADLQHIPLWGDTLVAPVAVKSPWSWITGLVVMLELAFVGNAAVEAWREGRKRPVKILAVAVCCSTVFSVAITILVMRAELPPPVIVTLPAMFTILVMAYGLSFDLLQKRQLSRNLRETEERMSLAADAADLGMWQWDIVRDRIWATKPSFERAGINESEHVDFNRFLQLVHPDDREPTQQAVHHALSGGGDFEAEYRIVTPDGTARWIAARGSVERGSNGKPLRLQGVSIDITNRKQAEEALRESERRLKEAQRIAHIGSWELDLLTNTLNWSDESCRIFEIDWEHFGASYEAFLDAIHPDDRNMVDNAYTQSLKNGQPYGITHRLLMPDGRIKYVHEQCETFYSPDGKPLRSLGTVQDITELKNAQEERMALRLELAHLNRVMTMNELSAVLAHEINQPLGAIMNNATAAQILTSKLTKGNEEAREILEDIIKDTNRAAQIVRKIRGTVKKGEVSYESLYMDDLVKEVLQVYQSLFRRDKISVRLDIRPDLAPIRGDHVRLQQVLMNLISNAVEAMKESPSKDLTIRSTMQSPDTITVSVSDSGLGIDDRIRAKIFQPFSTTKKDGLGMGLRICQSIVEEHGGRIWVENNLDGGTTFSFSLRAFQGESR